MIQKNLKKQLSLSPDIKDQLIQFNKTLDSFIDRHGEEYCGTDPVKDAEIINKKKLMKDL